MQKSFFPWISAVLFIAIIIQGILSYGHVPDSLVMACFSAMLVIAVGIITMSGPWAEAWRLALFYGALGVSILLPLFRLPIATHLPIAFVCAALAALAANGFLWTRYQFRFSANEKLFVVCTVPAVLAWMASQGFGAKGWAFIFILMCFDYLVADSCDSVMADQIKKEGKKPFKIAAA